MNRAKVKSGTKTDNQTKQNVKLTKRVLVYARVSTEEQTRGNYPSCASQIEELVSECLRRKWQVVSTVKDEGFSAGSLARPGLTQMRWQVTSGEVDVVLCTWYDRLTRSRDFYVLDKEFRANGVAFVTLHDPTDTATAAGRFMESVLVAAKTYDREQTGEKIRDKFQMRASKGMWSGRRIPYGFRRVENDVAIQPDPAFKEILTSMFRIYCETQSDFLVRDWLEANQISDPKGNIRWSVSTLRQILVNRRYIGEVEINRKNQGKDGLPDAQAYRIVPAVHEPMVPQELFELAQSTRLQKGAAFPNHRGRPRSFSQTQCGRVYLLQGLMQCACCEHAMTPYYVHHKAGEHGGTKRRKESFINYYICAQQMRNWKGAGHKNCILARRPEEWILERVEGLIKSPAILEEALTLARSRFETQSGPERELLGKANAALKDNQEQIDKLMGTLLSGQVNDALLLLVNERAEELKRNRELLLRQQARLTSLLSPLQRDFDAQSFHRILCDFQRISKYAEPVELQRLLRLVVRKIAWNPSGEHSVQFYQLPKTPLASGSSLKEKIVAENIEAKKTKPLTSLEGNQWFETSMFLAGA